jgi:hypothetical protein
MQQYLSATPLLQLYFIILSVRRHFHHSLPAACHPSLSVSLHRTSPLYLPLCSAPPHVSPSLRCAPLQHHSESGVRIAIGAETAEIQHLQEYRTNGEPGDDAITRAYGRDAHDNAGKITDSTRNTTSRTKLSNSEHAENSIIFLLIIRYTDPLDTLATHTPLFLLSSSSTLYDSFIAGECYSPMIESYS